MRKIILIFISLSLFHFSYSQTVEITKMSITTNLNPAPTDYEETPIELSPSASYSLGYVTFSWEDYDPDLGEIYFTLWKDDGFTKTKLNFSTFPAVGSGSTSINGSTTVSNPLGDVSFTIQASYYDENNIEQFLVESEPWTITRITNIFSNNTICCDQATISYPFDPVMINQITNTEVSTEDGSSISAISWEYFYDNKWTTIPGANQMSYDPPAINTDGKIRRVLTSSSGIIGYSNEITVKKVIEKISNNKICCSQTTAIMPFDPSPFQQAANTTLSSSIAGTTFKYQWQQGYTLNNWINIPGATNSTLDIPMIKNPTAYRRIVQSSNGTIDISNAVAVLLQPCNRPDDQQNSICGNMAIYKAQHGDLIIPGIILGSYVTPEIIRREFGFDYMISTDGITWTTAQPKHLLSVNSNSPYNICGQFQPPNPPLNPNLYGFFNPFLYLFNRLEGSQSNSPEPIPDPIFSIINGILPQNSTTANRRCAIDAGVLDYQMPPFIFDINKGAVQRFYIKRDYYQWYDDSNCGPLGAPFPCGSEWHYENPSNIAVIIVTSADLPKAVGPIMSSRDNVTCNWSDQTINFSVPQLNNGEYYKWEIPSSWTAYTALQGPYANQISVNTNNAEKNFATGGEVCLTVLQGSKIDRQCKTITGTPQFYSIIPAVPISACEGQTVILKPVLYGLDTDPNHYTYNWAAYQSPASCNNPAGSDLTNCKELKITVGNVRQNPNQEVTLTTTNAAGCIFKSTSKLTTAPGLQMGILNTYNDPAAIANSGLAVNTSTNNLFFTAKNKNIYRTYYDNTDKIWKYVPLKDKNTNKAILSDGPVAYYKGTTDKLFYIVSSALYYAESTDNGLTWVDKRTSVGYIVSNIDPRIKVYGNNIYYIDLTSRNVSYKDISTSNSIPPVLVGTVTVNYSQSMFTVEDGILTYANPSNVIVAFDAITGASLLINVPTPIKQVNYNSSISVYNKNIYFTSSYSGSSGALRIIKRNTSTGIYDNYEEAPGLQLAGPFAINKQTGTLYAKAYDVLGKQIYYLNNTWNTAPIVNYFSYSPIQSDMVYANGHAYYIGDNGYVSNTYYIAPCVPQVLRTANTVDEAGDVVNDPLSNAITEDRSVILYPNPTNNLVKATVTIPQESMVQIKIIPIAGGSTDIKYNASTESGTQDLSFDMSTYAAGIYIVQVYVNGSLYGNSKLIKY